LATVTGFRFEGWNPVLPSGVVVVTAPTPTVGGIVDSPQETTALGTVQRRGGSPSNKGIASLTNGVLVEHGERFWRNHWHIRPREFALGNILSAQQRFFYVHNGHRDPQNITAITETGADGVTLEDNGIPSFSVAAQDTIEYQLDIDTDGAPILNYSATFDFSPAGSLEVTAIGQRVIVFTYEPQGNAGGGALIESWEWNTDIIEAGDGSEQRVSMRNIPAQTWSMTIREEELISSRIHNLAYGWPANQLALPILIDESLLTAELTAGSNTLNVDTTTNRGYVVGGQVLIISGEFSFETFTIQSFTATQIVADNLAISTWPIGTRVYPVQVTNLGPINETLWKVRARQFDLQFRNVNAVDYADDSSFPTYKSLPRWNRPWLVDDTYGRTIDIGANRFDYGNGRHYDRAQRVFPRVSTTLTAFMKGRSDFWTVKRFLHARYGQRVSFWLSSVRNDLPLRVDSATTALDIEDVYYSDQIFANPKGVRRDIEVQFADGTLNQREITNAVRTPGVGETLTLDVALSQTPTLANVLRISFLYRVRLGTDRVEFRHDYQYHGSVQFPVVEVNA